MKNRTFYLAASCLFSGLAFAEPPADDGRIERAQFVRSLLKPGDVGAEIGVLAGVFAYHVLLPEDPLKLYLIDPWKYGLQKDMEIVITDEAQKGRDAFYENVRDTFSTYPNVEIIRKKSEDAVHLFADNYFDYVYIDGEHSYNAVWRDLTNYFPKLKVGGRIIGDDYGWAGIREAVDEFVRIHAEELEWGEDPYLGRTGGQFVIRRIK
jgi:hypothetical protein